MIREKTYSVKSGYFLILLLVLCLPSVSAQALEIDPELEEKIADDETTGYTIYFRQQPILRQAPRGGWKEQRDFIAKTLRETSSRSQARVQRYLFKARVPHRSLWKENIIIVDRSDRDTFEGLKGFPEIEAIRVTQQTKTPSPQGLEPAKKDMIPSGSAEREDGEITKGSEPDAHKGANKDEP